MRSIDAQSLPDRPMLALEHGVLAAYCREQGLNGLKIQRMVNTLPCAMLIRHTLPQIRTLFPEPTQRYNG